MLECRCDHLYLLVPSSLGGRVPSPYRYVTAENDVDIVFVQTEESDINEDIILSGVVKFLGALSAFEKDRDWVFPRGGRQWRDYLFDRFASSVVVVCY